MKLVTSIISTVDESTPGIERNTKGELGINPSRLFQKNYDPGGNRDVVPKQPAIVLVRPEVEAWLQEAGIWIPMLPEQRLYVYTLEEEDDVQGILDRAPWQDWAVCYRSLLLDFCENKPRGTVNEDEGRLLRDHNLFFGPMPGQVLNVRHNRIGYSLMPPNVRTVTSSPYSIARTRVFLDREI